MTDGEWQVGRISAILHRQFAKVLAFFSIELVSRSLPNRDRPEHGRTSTRAHVLQTWRWRVRRDEYTSCRPVRAR